MTPGTSRLSLLLAASLLACSCQSGPPTPRTHWSTNHWTIDSVPQRMVQHFTGYRSDRDSSYIDYQYRKKKHIDLALRRHFLNNNPDNPFEPDDPTRTERRPPHSIAPDPLHYMHLESLATGAVTLGMSGAFIPVPIDSVAATTFGGWDEFVDGFTGEDDDGREPPPPRKFRVKNR